MYRVLIVDDESYVVDWISDLLEAQTEPDFDICRAYSVAEALAWLNRAKIDIIITDVRMPKMSGIELAQKVRENWPQCKIIMLTAYSEFNYAYESIKNNVVSYILKDEDDAHILAEVRKATDLLDEEMKNVRLLQDIREQLNESTSAVQNELLLGLFGAGCADAAGLFRQLRDIGVNFDSEAPFLLFAARLETDVPESEIVERFRLNSAVKRLIGHYLGANTVLCFTEGGENRIVCLMQPAAGEQASKALVVAGGTLETIQRACQETLGLRVSFALHGSAVETSRLPGAVRGLNELLALQPENTEFVITAAAPGDARAVNGDVAGKLAGCLNADRLEDFQSALQAVCTRLESCPSWQDNAALELYYAAAVAVASYINRRKLSDRTALGAGLNGLFRPYDAGSWKNAADNLCRLSDAIVQLQREGEGQLSNSVILAVKNYIGGHIAEDVSLVRLSEVAGYNAAYLSHLFRRQTGITLKEYISRQKLVRIEELMADAVLNINDVAVKAGFESRTYFNNFLRRMTGMSPQEYRAHLRQPKKCEENK